MPRLEKSADEQAKEMSSRELRLGIRVLCGGSLVDADMEKLEKGIRWKKEGKESPVVNDADVNAHLYL